LHGALASSKIPGDDTFQILSLDKARELLCEWDMIKRLVLIGQFSLILFLVVLASCKNSSSSSVKDKSNTPATANRVKRIDSPTDSSPPQEIGSTSRIAWPPGMRRIAILPIYTTRPIGDAERDMDGIFRGEFSKVVKYEIVQVTRQDMKTLFNRDSFSSVEIIPPDLIRVLRQKYGADAVLFTDFTVFRPYRPLAIGVRTKIVDLKNMDVIWMADGVVDAAEPSVADTATHFASTGLQMNYISPTIPKGKDREHSSGNQIILQSPRLFAGFVAHDAYSSLAPLPPPPVSE
jgi:hypothetical protein